MTLFIFEQESLHITFEVLLERFILIVLIENLNHLQFITLEHCKK